MAKAFNLTAQINLQGPANIRPIVSNIKKQFSDIKADLKLNIDPKANTIIAGITKRIQTLTTSIDAASVSVNKLNIGLTTLGASLGQIKSVSGAVNGSVGKITTSSKASAKAAREAATEIQAFGDAAGLALKRFAAFSSVSTVIYGLVNSINDAISEFIIYDKELVRLSQVTGGAISSFGGLSREVQAISDEVRRLSTTLGVSSQDLIKVASTLSQAGLTADETRIALEALAKSSLAPSFDNIADTAEGAIAAIRQFGLGVGELESALGSINQVAADFAVESDDIIKAIQRTGGVFASASRGVSSGTDALNEFIAIFTSVRATTRESAETIATGLRTIFTRIQRGTTVDALKELGVELRDSEGKFVGAFEAVKRLSEGLSGIDPRSGTFAEIVEELGGFRQIGKVIPLIQQFAVSEQALASAQKGRNSLTKASEVAFYSLENQLAQTRQEFLALIADFANTGTFRGLTSSTLMLTRGLVGILGALKPLLPMLTLLATIKISSKLTEFIGGGGRVGFLSGLFKGAGGNTPTTSGVAPAAAPAGTPSMSPVVSSNTQAINALTAAIKDLTIVVQTRPGRTGFATGGLVGGVGNRDTVPAMLTPGEFVIRKKAVESIGVGNLENINRYASGGKVKDLINNEKGKYLSQTYDTDGPFDTYDKPTIDRTQVLRPNNTIAKYKTYRSTASSYLKQSRQIYQQDGIDAANKFLSDETNGLVAKMSDKDFDSDSPKPINKIQGALAEKDVQTNLQKQKLGPQKLPYIAGADFAVEGNNAFVEVKNKTKPTSDAELITKALLGYANVYGARNAVQNLQTGKTRKIKGFRDGKQTNISGLNITLYSTNPKDIVQEKYSGGYIQKFANGKEVELPKIKTSVYDSKGSVLDIEKTKRPGLINAEYARNKKISGSVNAQKIGPDLYAVDTAGVSKPGKGFGVPLYDAILEQVSSKGAWLTSSRESVSEKARSVWDFYRKKRPDVKNKQLPIQQWNMDPLFNGQVEGEPINDMAYQFPENLAEIRKHKKTWPPKDHPVWSLQYAYQKKMQKLATGGFVEGNIQKFKLGSEVSVPMEPPITTRISDKSIELSYNDPKVKGYLHAEVDPDNEKLFRVERVSVEPKGQGFGKKLYQKAMEVASQRNISLAPSKRSTSDSAFNVWQSMFGSENIETMPLDTKDWSTSTRSEKMQSKYPDLRYRNKSTHPPKEDTEFWSLNSAYRQKPVEKNDGGIIHKFAFGGSSKDTVPALLTPGEFVIRKEAAQKLGSATLHRMNNADKLQGYNKGGFIGGTPVQKFADGDFVPAPLSKKSPGNIEAYIQKILMSLDKAVRAAEKQTYDTARASGKGAKEAIELARQVRAEAAKKEASRLTTAVTTRGGPTQYIEKAQIENARKRMMRSISSGTDPFVRGATERKRTPGYFDRTPRTETAGSPPGTPPVTPPGAPPGTPPGTPPETPLEQPADQQQQINKSLVLLGVINGLIPQFKELANSTKDTNLAFIGVATQAAETAASFALTATAGLSALGADKKTVRNAALGAGVAGLAGGGLQAFGTTNIDKALKDASKSVSAFDKALQQVSEAPTAKLQVEAAKDLEKAFVELATSSEKTQEEISNYEWYEKLGSVITNTTSLYLSTSTALLAFSQATQAATVATQTKATADAAAAGAGGAAAATGLFATLGKIGAGFMKLNFYLQLAALAASFAFSAFQAFKSTGRIAQQLDQFGKSLENMTKNSNDYNLANRRFVNELNRYSKISANLDEQVRTGAITETQRKQTEKRIFGGSEKVTDTGFVKAGGGLNEFNLQLDQFIRTQARMKGITIESTKSLEDTLNSLDKTSESFKILEGIIASVGDANSDLMKEFEKITFIRSFTNPIGKEAQALSPEEAEKLYNRTSEAERKRISQDYVATINQQNVATKNLTLAQRSATVSALNFIDVLNRVNGALSRIGTDFSNSIDDASYRLELFTSESANIRPDTSAARSIEILRNLPAFGTAAFGQAEGQQQLDDAITKALAPLQIERSPNRELRGDAERLRGSIKALRELEIKAPQALREFISSREEGVGAGTAGLRDTLLNILKPLDLKPEFQGTLLDEIIGVAEKSLSGEGTKSIEDLANNFPSVVQGTDSFKRALETAIKSLETQDLKNKKLAEAANATAAALQKVTNLQIRAAELRMNTELEMSQIRGRTPGLRELNAPFDATIRRLTQSIGGSSDPAKIVAGLKRETEKLSKGIQAGLDTTQLGGLASNINDLKQALNMLGDKNTRLVNALDNLRKVEEERKGVGNIFEEMIKASGDPIAMGQIEATLAAATRVRAGGTDLNDIKITLEKYIPMLSQAGGRFAEDAEKLRTQIQTRVTERAGVESLQSGDIFGFLRASFLRSIVSGGQTAEIQKNVVEPEIQTAESAMLAQATMIDEEIRRFGVSVGDATTEFKDNFAKVWPGIIYEMKQFQAELAAINLKENAIDLEQIDISGVYDIVTKNLNDIAKTINASSDDTFMGIPAFSFGPGISGPLPGATPSTENILPFKRAFEVTEELDKYGIKTGKQKLQLKPNFEKDIGVDGLSQILNDLITKAEKGKDTKLVQQLRIQLDNLNRYNQLQQERQKLQQRAAPANQTSAVAPTTNVQLTEAQQRVDQINRVRAMNRGEIAPGPLTSPTQITSPYGARIDTQRPQQPVGGGAFMIPPENVRPTAQAVNVTATKTKLDFDYNDFITKFSRAFDTETGKFRDAIGNLSLSFTALNPPIDKFSKSVTTLIDGLNTINDSGGIKGPNIPEKVTVEVVFGENLTIDTSRINNNDLLDRIGVVTTEAVNKRIEQLKLTGK